MAAVLHKPALALAVAGSVAACDAASTGAPQGGVARAAKADGEGPQYLGIDTRLLADDLVQFRVAMKGARTREDVVQYARCAAAQYALIRGYGFARHLRSSVKEKDGISTGDAVYTISAALPRGLKTIDAEVTAAECAQNGIPMV